MKELAEIDQALEDLGKDRVERLSDRFVQVQEEIDRLQDSSRRGGLTGDEQQELRDLREELKLLNTELTQDQQDEANRVAGLSETERILEEIEAEKQKLEERRVVVEEEIALEEQKNNALVEDLQTRVESETALFDKLTTAKIELERKFTQEQTAEVQKQIDNVRRLEERVRNLIRLQRQAGISPRNT